MDISSAYALLPRTAKKMGISEYMNYLNYVVGEDLYGILSSRYPDYYRRKFHAVVSAQSLSGTFLASGGIITATVAAHTLQVGDVVKITGTTSFNGTYVVLTAPGATTFTLATSNTTAVPISCTFKIPYRITLPSGIVSIEEINDVQYGKIVPKQTSMFDETPLNVMIDNSYLIIPANSPLTSLEIDYVREIPAVSSTTDTLPVPTAKVKEVLSCINYGVALAWARDWKKADDMKVFYDSYMQAKSNLATLSNGVLGE